MKNTDVVLIIISWKYFNASSSLWSFGAFERGLNHKIHSYMFFLMIKFLILEILALGLGV